MGKHAHSHGGAHDHHHGADLGSLERIRLAFFLNAGFAVFEIIGGIWAGSLAILADGWHDLGDAFSLGLAWLFERASKRGPTLRFTYGYRRYSLLSAIIVGLVLVAGSALIIREAVPRLWAPGEPRSDLMLVFAVIGVAVNGLAVWKMREGRSANEWLISWHLLEDLLGWIAVLVGALLIRAFGWNWLDPVLALGIAAFILWHVASTMRSTIDLFLQKAPDDFDIEKFRSEAAALPNVAGLHDLHAWSLDGHHHVLSAHVIVREPGQAAEVKASLRELAGRDGHFHMTIEIETETELCDDRCEEPAKK